MRKIIQILQAPTGDRLFGIDNYGSLWSWDGSWQLETMNLPILPDPVDDPLPCEGKEEVALNMGFK